MVYEFSKARFVELFGSLSKVKLVDLADIEMGQSPESSSYNYEKKGIPFFQGSADFTEKYANINMYCTNPKKIAYPDNILLSVRAPVGAVNFARTECCIGRGLAAITSKKSVKNNQFLLYCFKNMEKEIALKGKGSTVKSITKSDLQSILFPDASEDLQKEFVFFAEQIDKSKVELEKTISSLQAVYKKILNDNLG